MADGEVIVVKVGEVSNDLTKEEREAVQTFIHQLSLENAFGDGVVVTDEEATRFLMARKFDVGRAISLFHTNRMLRGRFELEDLNPHKEPLSSELHSGKFTVLDGRGDGEATICLFFAKKHYPKLVDHITVLRSLVYQLDHVMASRDSQRHGLSLIYDMTGSGYQNFDFDLALKVLHLLKGGYPARLKHVYILSAPLWFRASMAVLSTFLRDKIRDRVEVVRPSDLIKHFSKDILPEELGGTTKHNHETWIQQCVSANKTKSVDNLVVLTHDKIKQDSKQEVDNRHIFEDKESHILPPVDKFISDTPSASSTDQSSSTTITAESSLPPGETLSKDDIPPPKPPRKPLPAPPVDEPEVPELDESYDNDDNDEDESPHVARNVDEFLTHLANVGKRGVYHEYEELRSYPPTGEFETTVYTTNLRKNRYNNILAYEETRVHLNIINNDPFSDYINANYVDGYEKKNKFICTQGKELFCFDDIARMLSEEVNSGPTPQTYFDFWRMIWEQRIVVIIMITRCVERGRVKCGQYWPEEEDETMKFGYLTVSKITADIQDDYTSTLFELRNEKLNISRRVCHIQFTSWPDFGVLQSALPILEVMELIEQYQNEGLIQINNEMKQNVENKTNAGNEPVDDLDNLIGSGEYATLSPSNDINTDAPKSENTDENTDLDVELTPPPVVVHCSAGVGRTGTFCCLSNSMERLEAEGKMDIFNTVYKIRSQRAFSVQTPEQYQFCYTGILEGLIKMKKDREEDTTELEQFLYDFLVSPMQSDSE